MQALEFEAQYRISVWFIKMEVLLRKTGLSFLVTFKFRIPRGLERRQQHG